ncbi:RNA polymerase sigma factor [Chitinophaga sp. Cy-1792]|uniref:RNA polymerase sigma factor n=1 Tax=Chitinophaga sp. Cy-1792 TaxID=2608339 RepID=UPI001422BF11|nr:RNA polymerase sigma-70 factor [Chitinophaga sp. Cy-1792]NIG56792.1 RNA polymerase sigma-70 factor [Chitinophaga sp. Cy-1792]
MDLQSRNHLLSLFAQIADGDAAAFTTLFNTYHSRIFSTALQYCKVREQANDITQLVFSIIWEKRASLPPVEDAEAWMWTITKNQTLKLLKRESYHKSYVSYARALFEEESDTPLHQLILRQKGEVIEGLIKALPARQEEVYRLSRYEGASYAEIAEKLGIGVETVKEHMAKALKKMKAQLLLYREEIISLLATVWLINRK